MRKKVKKIARMPMIRVMDLPKMITARVLTLPIVIKMGSILSQTLSISRKWESGCKNGMFEPRWAWNMIVSNSETCPRCGRNSFFKIANKGKKLRRKKVVM